MSHNYYYVNLQIGIDRPNLGIPEFGMLEPAALLPRRFARAPDGVGIFPRSQLEATTKFSSLSGT